VDESESTLLLLERCRNGDATAREALFARYLPQLRRWASGRLPRWARDIADTTDLVQETLLQTFKRIDRFEPRSEDGFRAYLRQAVMNRVRDELRKHRRRPAEEELDSQQMDVAPSPLDHAIAQQALDRYDKAMAKLDESERDAIVGRLELGLSYEELAAVLMKPSPDAARKAAQRALIRLAEVMKDDK
jgi:RNA polymerase sigma-70 factor (ECF subfamily)